MYEFAVVTKNKSLCLFLMFDGGPNKVQRQESVKEEHVTWIILVEH